jgi:hypothetical protein
LILVFRHSHRSRDGRLFHMQRQACSDQADVASTFEFSSRHDDQSAPQLPGSQTNRRTLFTMSHNGIRQDARHDAYAPRETRQTDPRQPGIQTIRHPD